LCKDYLCLSNERSEKWICHSVYMKNNQDIPDEWAKCESGIDEKQTLDQYRD